MSGNMRALQTTEPTSMGVGATAEKREKGCEGGIAGTPRKLTRRGEN